MRTDTLLELLDNLSPFESQEEWDNCGLLVGEKSREIRQIYLALEADLEIVEQVEPHSALIVHHPIIFKALKRLEFSTYPAKILEILIQKEITLIALHTNFDKSHLNAYLAHKILGFQPHGENDLFCSFDVNMDFQAFHQEIAKKLQLPFIKTVGEERVIKKATIVCGSGASLLPYIQTDCLLTGDIKYHDAVAAKTLGINLIDIGHYESERFFPECLQKELQNHGISAIIPASKNPFAYHLQESHT